MSNRLSTSSFPAWPNAHQADKCDLDTQDLLDSDVKFMRVEGKLMETGSESVRTLSVHGRLSCGFRPFASSSGRPDEKPRRVSVEFLQLLQLLSVLSLLLYTEKMI